MFCETCGSRVDEDALACGTCGVELRTARQPRAEAAEGLHPAPELELTGPKCTLHPGLPLAGTCPRCHREVCIRCAPEAARDNFTCTDCAGLTRAHQSAPLDAACAVHPEARASFICSRCGSFACAGCAVNAPGQQGLCARCGSTAGVLASRGDRFVANLIDNFVFVVPAILAIAIATLFFNTGKGRGVAEYGFLFAIVGGVAFGCVAQIIAQLQWGQSLGKRALGIKVIRLDGRPIELWRLILLRNVVVQALSQACGVAGLIDALLIFGEERRCLHDYLADSIVVDAPKD
jgi:uncharacterized RDD family membrane protein YckC